MGATPQGWYPDPAGGTGKRYWDGTAWSDGVVPASKKRSTSTAGWVVLIGSVVIFAGSCVTILLTGQHDSGPRGNPSTDVYPTSDGVWQVSHGVFGTGITTGWIETAGPRPGSQACSWDRLSGPTLTIEETIASDRVEAGPVRVKIGDSDVAFATYGCLPWHRIS